MRIVYMDEAGRAHVEEEPNFVVACAIIDPDTQWHLLRRHYADMANDIFGLSGDEAYDEYVFHAKDIWHGSGDFTRAQFSLQDRMKILARLSDVPRFYSVPICLGIINRQTLHEQLQGNPKFRRHLEHAYAYTLALQYVDCWMQKNCPNEVAMVAAEDTDEVKQTIQAFHDCAIKKDTFDDFYDRGIFKSQRIVDSVNFVKKRDSSLLQIADHCAFLAKRTSVGCPHAKAIWRNVAPQVCKENKHESAALVMLVPLDHLKAIDLTRRRF